LAIKIAERPMVIDAASEDANGSRDRIARRLMARAVMTLDLVSLD